jgi:membrane protein YdbS with pleckstrin-like domain
MEDLFDRDEVVNDLIGRADWDGETLRTSAPDPKNALARTVIAGGMLTGLAGVGTAVTVPAFTIPVVGGVMALFLPMTGWVYWSVSVVKFQITPRGIVRKSGILYRTRQTILLENIDHVDKSEGVLNKTFGNGSIHIYTAGSSSREMQFADAPDYRRLYDHIQDLYRGAPSSS